MSALLVLLAIGLVLAAPLLLSRLRHQWLRTADSFFWFGLFAIVAGGRPLAGVGFPLFGLRLYITEILLGWALLVCVLRPRSGGFSSVEGILTLFVFLQLARLVITGSFDPASLQRFGVVEYMIFALAGSRLAHDWRAIRNAAIVSGQVVGLIALANLAMDSASFTVNGSTRYMSSNQAIASVAAILMLLTLNHLTIFTRVGMGALPLLGLLLTYQRSSWLAAGIAVGVVAAFRLPGLLKSRSGQIRFVLVALALTPLLISPPALDQLSTANDKITGIGLSEDPNVAFRVEVQQQQLKEWFAEPVMGVGFSRSIFRYTVGDGGAGVDGHNGWVTLLWRTGPLGVAIALLAACLALRSCLHQRHLGGSAWFAGLIIGVAIGASFNVWLEVPYVAPLFWAAVGAALVPRSSERCPPTGGKLIRRTRGSSDLASRCTDDPASILGGAPTRPRNL